MAGDHEFTKSYYDPTTTTITAYVGAVEGGIGLMMNILSIIVLLRSKRLRKNPISPLICALTLSDLVFCLSLGLTLYQFYNNKPYEEDSPLCYLSPISYR